jgi:hypothetical protein
MAREKMDLLCRQAPLLQEIGDRPERAAGQTRSFVHHRELRLPIPQEAAREFRRQDDLAAKWMARGP